MSGGRHANNLNGSGSDSGSLSPRTDTSIDATASRGSSKRKAKRAERRGSMSSLTATSAGSANDRERDRMHSINEAFKTLKNSLPFIPPDTKLSKIRTLRYAINYISHLSQELGIDVVVADAAPEATKRPLPCDWQVGFSGVATTPYAYHTAPRFRVSGGSDQFPASYAQPGNFPALHQVVHHC
ncbi:transcription factor 21-like [Oscarella lobularis]|uniref:transcription factor 21-like n=1 Tax=Oscarella lobularis TaxID=121494 RepID=UPI0033132198